MTSVFKFFKTVLIFIIIGVSNLHLQATGLIPLMNYQKSDYNFGSQNWDFTQDGAGVIYVANYNGLLTFDGIHWQHYYLPNYSAVRSVYYNPEDSRIYAGGSNEFGFYYGEPATGCLNYQSLSENLPLLSGNFGEVWNIIPVNNGIIFRCDHSLFSYKDENLEKLNIPGKITYSTLIGHKVYLGMEDGRILSLLDGKFNTLKEEGRLNDKKIVGILPYDDNSLLICTPFDGLFTLEKGEINTLDSNFSNYLKDNQVFCSVTNKDKYAFGTVTGGVLVYDKKNRETDIINKDTGLKNNTVLNMGFDRHDNLWLGLDNGLAYVALDSPCRKLIGETSFIGAGYSATIFGDKLLLGTNQGLYISDKSNFGESLVKETRPLLQGQIWSITPYNDLIFISSDRGLFTFDGKNLSKIPGINGAYKILPFKNSPGKFITSTYDSFYFLERQNGQWLQPEKIEGSRQLTGDFLLDDQNNVWLAHWQNGIYCLTLNPDKTSFSSFRLFDKSSGLPADENNSFAFFEGKPIASTYAGFYSLDPFEGKAMRNEQLCDLGIPGRRGQLRELENGSLALIDQKGIMLIERKNNGNIEAKDISGPGLFNEIIPGYTQIKNISPNKLLVSTQSGFTLVNTDNPEPRENSLPFVSAVYCNQDSLVFQSSLSGINTERIIIPYNLNSMKFEFAYPESIFPEKTEFSSYLENFDKEWSPFSSQASREYTRLQEGNYILRLKVRDNYSGDILESSFGFTISPPWYRTAWAKGFYCVLSFLVLFLLFVWIKKRLIQIRLQVEKRKEAELQDIRKENEKEALKKDMEIAGLKNEQLEQEIKFKSDELSSTTMSLISKNEILREIGEQIDTIHKQAAEVPVGILKKNLSKLKESVENNISKNTDWNTFNRNFEVVYGDYMKRLLKLHPDLSQSEKRLCCYIRMGLSSKEIAPLINISFRSVEMARYRLRKKISLSPESSLTDYLTAI